MLFPKQPTLAVRFPHSVVTVPPNIPCAGCITCRRDAAGSPKQPPSPCSPPSQVLPASTVIHDGVTSVSGPWENRWLPQIREIPGGLFTKGGCFQNGAVTEPQAVAECRAPGPAPGDRHRPQGWRGEGEATRKREAPRGGLTWRTRGTARPRPPPGEAGIYSLISDQGHSTGQAHWVWRGGGCSSWRWASPGRQPRMKPSADFKSCTLYTLCIVL